MRVRLLGAAIHRATPVPFNPMPGWKRAMDIGGAVLGLIVCFPLLILFGAFVKITSRGDILYRQTRAGLNGKSFTMFKIRTMVQNADERKAGLLDLNERDGPAFKIRNDPRVTPIGNFLRRTSLDELPQLWNVLKGEMSSSAHAPLPRAMNRPRAIVLPSCRRLAAMPGITCIWQISVRSGCLIRKLATDGSGVYRQPKLSRRSENPASHNPRRHYPGEAS